MSRWQLRTAPQFAREARQLDRQVLTKVKTYLEGVCELDDPRQRGKGLTANLTSYWRYRLGDWRVLVEIRDTELVIVAITIRHRSEVFRFR